MLPHGEWPITILKSRNAEGRYALNNVEFSAWSSFFRGEVDVHHFDLYSASNSIKNWLVSAKLKSNPS